MLPDLLEDDLECVVARLSGGQDELAKTKSGIEAWEGSACSRCCAKDRGRISAKEGVAGVKTVAGKVLNVLRRCAVG